MKVFAHVVVFMSSATVKQLKTSRTDSRSKRLLVPVMVKTSDHQLDEPVGNLLGTCWERAVSEPVIIRWYLQQPTEALL